MRRRRDEYRPLLSLLLLLVDEATLSARRRRREQTDGGQGGRPLRERKDGEEQSSSQRVAPAGPSKGARTAYTESRENRRPTRSRRAASSKSSLFRKLSRRWPRSSSWQLLVCNLSLLSREHAIHSVGRYDTNAGTRNRSEPECLPAMSHLTVWQAITERRRAAQSRATRSAQRHFDVTSMIQSRERGWNVQRTAHLDQLADFQAFVVSLRVPSLAMLPESLHFSLDDLARLGALGKFDRRKRFVGRQVVEKSRRDPDLRSMAGRAVVETLFQSGDSPRSADHLVVTCRDTASSVSLSSKGAVGAKP